MSLAARRLNLVFFALFFAALVAAVANFGGRPGYYPNVTVEIPGDLQLFFLREAHPERFACETTAAAIANAIQVTCPTCRILSRQCVTRLKPDLQKLLSTEPIDVPSARMAEGVILYNAANGPAAMAACSEAERQTSGKGPLQAKCYPAGVSRPMVDGFASSGSLSRGMSSAVMLLLSMLTTAFATYLVVRYQALHSRWSADPLDSRPQKFHSVPTPRIGGLCLVFGLFISHLVAATLEQRTTQDQLGYLLLASGPAFLVGITEDVTKSVGVQLRLAITMIAACCGAWLLNGIVPRLDVGVIDRAMIWAPLAIAFTIFAVSGVSNAMNIIDGYNGLAAGYGVIVLSALGLVSYFVGDAFLVFASLAMIGALAGFLVFNYPRGLIFLGDSGAYLLGFWCAEVSVLLVARHPEVSPWFPMSLLIYPIFETVFSMYRRKVVRGKSPGYPDRLHLHQMIYMRVVRCFAGPADAALMTRRNSLVAPYIWGMTLVGAAASVLVWHDTRLLMLVSLMFCVAYTWLYGRIVHWRTPSWLVRRTV